MRQNSLPMPAARPSDLKLNNRLQILELFKSGAVYSVADLAREIGVSRQTVMKGIQFFLEKGVLVSDGKADSGSMGGKRAELFTLAGDKYLFCLMICADSAKLTLMNFRREIIDRQVLQDIGGMEAPAFVEMASAECRRMLSDRGIALENARGLCIATTGLLAMDGTVRCLPSFPAWGKNVPIVRMFSERLGGDMLVIAEHMGLACGCGYMRDHDVSKVRVATLLTCWDDISACLIHRGQIVSGKGDLAGEFGHMTVAHDEGEVCVCGSQGCLERRVSAARLRAMAAEARDRFPGSSLYKLLPDTLTIREVFAASARGDALAQWLSAYAARQFAAALRNLGLVFSPDRVVFQGDYANADSIFLDTLRYELRVLHCLDIEGRICPPFTVAVDPRSPASLCVDGAYTLLIDRLFSDEATYA